MLVSSLCAVRTKNGSDIVERATLQKLNIRVREQKHTDYTLSYSDKPITTQITVLIQLDCEGRKRWYSSLLQLCKLSRPDPYDILIPPKI